MKKKYLMRLAVLPILLFFLQLSVKAQDVHRIPNTVADTLENFIEDISQWDPGDVIVLESDGEYIVSGTIDVFQEVTIMGDPSLSNRPLVTFKDNGFRVKADSISIAIKGINFNGKVVVDTLTSEVHYARAILRFEEATLEYFKDVVIEDCEAWGFQGGLHLNSNNKGTIYDNLTVNNVVWHDFTTLEYAIDPKVNYVKNLSVTNSTFYNIEGGFLTNVGFSITGDATRPFVDQTVTVDHNTLYNIGGISGKSLIQMNDANDGSVTFTFSNNVVSKLGFPDVARPFRLNELAGSFDFKNSVFHDFYATVQEGTNLDSVALLSNVTLTDVDTDADYPGFKDTTSTADPLSFLLPEGSALLTAGTDGGPIGDPRWFASSHEVVDLEAFIENTSLWNPGDTILLTEKEYTVGGTIDVFQEVTIMGDPSLSTRPLVTFKDNGFRVKADSISIAIKGINFNGKVVVDPLTSEVHYARAILRFEEATLEYFKDVVIEDCEAWGFQGGLHLNSNNKGTIYDNLTVNNVVWHDFTSFEYAIDPKVNYVKSLSVTNSTFYNIEGGFLTNVGFSITGDSTRPFVEQTVTIDHNTLYNIGGLNKKSLIQMNDANDGSVTFTFSNNVVSKLGFVEEARPFRLNELAGTFTFNNSVFHDFYSNYEGGIHNLDSVAELSNVTLESVDTDAGYPGFKDTAAYNFLLPEGSLLLTAGTDGGAIGDPRWSGATREVLSDLEAFIEDTTRWNPGDTILLTKSEYFLEKTAESGTLGNGTIDIYQDVIIMGDPSMDIQPMLHFVSAAFRPGADSISITLSGFDLNGLSEEFGIEQRAGHIITIDNPYSYLDMTVDGVNAEGFGTGIELYRNKGVHYKSLVINDVVWSDITGMVLDPRINATDEIEITNSTFFNVGGFLKNPYFADGEDGRDETIVQNILIDHNTFYNVLTGSNSLLQVNDPNDGGVILEFTNNIVSTLKENTNTRPFRINELAGTFTISHSVFHDFNSLRDNGIHNIDSVALQSNVTVSEISSDDPGFKDVSANDFSLSEGSPLLSAGTDGGFIGDPRWRPKLPGISGPGVHPIPNLPADTLMNFLHATDLWDPGDTILLISDGEYLVTGTPNIYQEVTILGDPTLAIPPRIRMTDNGFRLREDSINVTLKGFNMIGYPEADETDRAPFILRFSDATYNGNELTHWGKIWIEDVDAEGFNGGLELRSKDATYDSLIINNVVWSDMTGESGGAISGSYIIDPKASYTKYTSITNSTFDEAVGFFKNPYFSDPADLATYPVKEQEIVIDHCTFYRIGANNNSLIQINDQKDGAVTLTFSNNIVSGLREPNEARPFRIDPTEGPGSFTFTNSVFHDFVPTNVDQDQYSLDSVVAQPNIDTSFIYTAYPEFADTVSVPRNFLLPLNSQYLAVGTDDGPIGDPRWFPQVGVTITPLTEALVEGNSVQLTADVVFGEGVDLSLTWSVINGHDGTAGEATIDNTGLLNAVADGKVLVVATSNFSNAYSDTLEVTIEPVTLVSSITLIGKNGFNTETNKIDSKNGELTITATILPGDAADKTVTWSLSDESLVDILESDDVSIKIQAKASGTLTVTATANDASGVTGTFDVFITRQRPVTDIAVSTANGESEVAVDATLQMVATVIPEDADNDSVAWSVDNEEVATISAEGVLTGLKAGTVVVKAMATDNTFRSGTMTITVVSPLGLNPVTDLAEIYPNPAGEVINVNVKSGAVIRIHSLSGSTVLSRTLERSGKVNIGHLESGIYIIDVRSGNEVQSIKFKKQ